MIVYTIEVLQYLKMVSIQIVHAACFAFHCTSSFVFLVLLSINSPWNALIGSAHSLRTENGTVLVVTESKSFMPAWMLWGAGMISASMHWYQWKCVSIGDMMQILHTGVNVYRWIDYGLSSPLMLAVVQTLCGITNEWLVVTSMMFQSTLMLACLFMEQCKNDITYKFVYCCAVYLIGIWGPVFSVLSDTSPPDFVYVIVFGIFEVFSCFAVVFFIVNFGYKTPEWGEIVYASASITSKLLLQWTLYGGVISASSGNSSVVVGIITGCILIFGLLFSVIALKTSDF